MIKAHFIRFEHTFQYRKTHINTHGDNLGVALAFADTAILVRCNATPDLSTGITKLYNYST